MGAVVSDSATQPLAIHPELLAPVSQIMHRAIATFLNKQVGIKRSEAATGAIKSLTKKSLFSTSQCFHGHVFPDTYLPF